MKHSLFHRMLDMREEFLHVGRRLFFDWVQPYSRLVSRETELYAAPFPPLVTAG